MQITGDMTIMQVLQEKPECAQVFLDMGMHCLGCAMAHGETVEQACAAHGKDLIAMLDKLNSIE